MPIGKLSLQDLCDRHGHVWGTLTRILKGDWPVDGEKFTCPRCGAKGMYDINQEKVVEI